MSNDVTAEVTNAVVAEILSHDDLANDGDWDTYALVAEVTDDAEIMAAFLHRLRTAGAVSDPGGQPPAAAVAGGHPRRRRSAVACVHRQGPS